MVDLTKKVKTKRMGVQNILELETGDLGDKLNVKGLG